MADTELFPPAQVVALIECMLATARVDGLQPQEVELLRGFHAAQQQPGLPAFDQILNAPGPEQAPIDAVRADPGFADEVVRMCLVTGYADGNYRIEDIFGFRQTGVDAEGNAGGEFYTAGYRPKCMQQIDAAGISLPADLFEAKTVQV